jgi:hypothetical protein
MAVRSTAWYRWSAARAYVLAVREHDLKHYRSAKSSLGVLSKIAVISFIYFSFFVVGIFVDSSSQTAFGSLSALIHTVSPTL